MSYTKSERRFKNRLHMRLSQIDLNDRTPATKKQIDDFIESCHTQPKLIKYRSVTRSGGQMSLVRTCEGKFARHTMTKMPVVEGVKFRCDKCGCWFEELWEIRRTVNKAVHLAVWPSINGLYCKDCTNKVWYYDVLGNKKEKSK